MSRSAGYPCCPGLRTKTRDGLASFLPYAAGQGRGSGTAFLRKRKFAHHSRIWRKGVSVDRK